MSRRMNMDVDRADAGSGRNDHALSCLFRRQGGDSAQTPGSLATWDLDRLGGHLRRDIGLECGQ